MREHQHVRPAPSEPDSSPTLQPLRVHPHLYEIHTWAWLEQLSAAQGKRITLAGVPDSDWDALAELGFDVVWLMGVWERSPRARRIARTETSMFAGYDEGRPGWRLEDVAGSPYAIHNYQPDARIGSWEDLDGVRRKLHARGMRLLLDFVANHTAPDHPWVTQQPEVYVQGTLAEYRQDPGAFTLVEDNGRAFFLARGRDPNYPPWTDTVQVNHSHPAGRAALLGTLREVARHCDGVRCDMAMLSLNEVFDRTWGHLVDEPRPATEFWTEAVAAVPGFLWLGEVYWDMEPRLQQLGFQFTYDKTLFDRLRYAAPPDVNQYLAAPVDFQSRMARFLENHDEGRSVAVFGRDRVEALAA
ncbi:MAG TPA: alpha-amylase family glycosyl hydrolase, partial [Candidatus Acidoferrales bacterium]